jgi:hypothetical protein
LLSVVIRNRQQRKKNAAACHETSGIRPMALPDGRDIPETPDTNPLSAPETANNMLKALAYFIDHPTPSR